MRSTVAWVLPRAEYHCGQWRARAQSRQVTLNMDCFEVPLKSTFQVVGITRPLMSVGRICDQGLKCLFEKNKATVLSPDNVHVCESDRRGGLYVATLTLNAPEGFGRQAR